MITSRYITQDDKNLLATSLASDEFHRETSPEFFYENDSVCSVFEDEDGPILFVKASPIEQQGIVTIRLDIQYLNNSDARRNLKAMLFGFPIIEERAKAAGFAGFIFHSEAPLLRKFCVKRLGFFELNEQYLGKILDTETGDMR